jgi:anti-sigma factor RsiW
MRSCSFEKLVQLLDKKLNLDTKLELFDHLDRCDNCREAVYQISRDRDRAFYISRPGKRVKTAVA